MLIQKQITHLDFPWFDLIDSLLWASTIVDFAFIECYVIKKKKKKITLSYVF